MSCGAVMMCARNGWKSERLIRIGQGALSGANGRRPDTFSFKENGLENPAFSGASPAEPPFQIAQGILAKEHLVIHEHRG